MNDSDAPEENPYRTTDTPEPTFALHRVPAALVRAFAAYRADVRKHNESVFAHTVTWLGCGLLAVICLVFVAAVVVSVVGFRL